MRRFGWLIGALLAMVGGILVLAMSASAQDTPRVELSAGYSYFRVGTSGRGNFHGGSVSVVGNLTNWFGLVADVGGYHASAQGAGVNLITYQVGPRISFRSHSRVTPFAQVLAGGAHLTASGALSGSANAFAYSAGGGVDIRVSDNIAIRALQVEYVGLRSQGETQGNGRASAGIVFRFGRK